MSNDACEVWGRHQWQETDAGWVCRCGDVHTPNARQLARIAALRTKLEPPCGDLLHFHYLSAPCPKCARFKERNEYGK